MEILVLVFIVGIIGSAIIAYNKYKGKSAAKIRRDSTTIREFAALFRKGKSFHLVHYPCGYKLPFRK